jgi:four helix bundle protein
VTYDRFEDLPVWRLAVEIAMDVDALVQDRVIRSKGDLADQLQRSSLSISNNIAEGFERGSTSELICFLYIARGSAGETCSGLHVGSGMRGMEHLKDQMALIIQKCLSVSRQLRRWLDSLQNSDIKGQRHLNDVSRAQWEQERRREAFMKKLTVIRQGGTKADQPDSDAAAS